MFFKQFGGSLNSRLLQEYQQSPNWKAGSFQNLEVAELTPSLWKIPGILYRQLTQGGNKEPQQPLPVQAFDISQFRPSSPKARFIWYGHSALFLCIKGKYILIDPMLGPDTTPIAPIPTKRFSENTLDLIDHFPPIDLILFTHDHYDHLDYASVQKLKAKTKQYFVALGLKRHLVSWGVEANRITEMDWWNTQQFAELQITYTPTQHFSGRGLRDRLKCLWGGWAIKTDQENMWFSGDGGYGPHFKTIGERLGPFDFAFMECGQYNEDWRPVHLFPDEAVKAAIDARVQKAMPVHWAGFALSYQHSWREPAEDFVYAAKAAELPYTLPKLGMPFEIAGHHLEHWWELF
ncbi:MAG: MBL fold metallo-hydrolase [Bacteroidota bacterium]